MITGLGFSEVLIVGMLVLVFFGSKELPQFVRSFAGLLAKLRRYSDHIRRELDEMTSPLHTATQTTPHKSPATRKQDLRTEYLARRKALSDDERVEKSAEVLKRLVATREYTRARAVMTYVSCGAEVDTRNLIRLMREQGKRVCVPFCRSGYSDLGIAEIEDPHIQLVPGTFGILEPLESLRGNFLKSDLGLIVVPGVAFDKNGGRLGRGKHFYDSFLKDVKGRAHIFGLAYAVQLTPEILPFEYHDVAMDQIVTEEGLLLPASELDTE